GVEPPRQGAGPAVEELQDQAELALGAHVCELASHEPPFVVPADAQDPGGLVRQEQPAVPYAAEGAARDHHDLLAGWVIFWGTLLCPLRAGPDLSTPPTLRWPRTPRPSET